MGQRQVMERRFLLLWWTKSWNYWTKSGFGTVKNTESKLARWCTHQYAIRNANTLSAMGYAIRNRNTLSATGIRYPQREYATCISNANTLSATGIRSRCTREREMGRPQWEIRKRPSRPPYHPLCNSSVLEAEINTQTNIIWIATCRSSGTEGRSQVHAWYGRNSDIHLANELPD